MSDVLLDAWDLSSRAPLPADLGQGLRPFRVRFRHSAFSVGWRSANSASSRQIWATWSQC